MPRREAFEAFEAREAREQIDWHPNQSEMSITCLWFHILWLEAPNDQNDPILFPDSKFWIISENIYPIFSKIGPGLL